jgi:hypothetical protein
VKRVDEERIRKVAAENPDLLHCRLAQRFGISTGRLRKIIGFKGRGELPTPMEMSRSRYTPRPGGHISSIVESGAATMRTIGIRKQLQGRLDATRTAYEAFDTAPHQPAKPAHHFRPHAKDET